MAWVMQGIGSILGQMFRPAAFATEDLYAGVEEEILCAADGLKKVDKETSSSETDDYFGEIQREILARDDKKKQEGVVIDSWIEVVQDGCNNLKKIYEDTLEACQGERYLNEHDEYVKLPKIRDIRMELSAPIQKPSIYLGSHQTRFQIISEDVLTIACRLKEEGNNVGVLAVSDCRNPFEQIEKGCESEELDIGRRSSLVPMLKQLKYPRPSSCAIFMDLFVFRDKEYRFMEKPVEMKCVVSSPHEKDDPARALSVDEYEKKKKNIRTQVEPLARNGCTHLVLGAFECGMKGTLPSVMARLFKEVIIEQFYGCFESITFAILDEEGSESMQAFQALCANMNELHLR